MINYIHAYDNPAHPRYHEARKLSDMLRTETVITPRGVEKGVMRWKKDRRVIPREHAIFARKLGMCIHIPACNVARERER